MAKNEHGVPLSSNEQLVKGTQGICTEIFVQKKMASFCAFCRQAMVGVCTISPLVHWTRREDIPYLRNYSSVHLLSNEYP